MNAWPRTGQQSAMKMALAATRPTAFQSIARPARNTALPPTSGLTRLVASRDWSSIASPDVDYDVGVSGGRYYGVCRVNQEADFLDAYNVGHQLYTLGAT